MTAVYRGMDRAALDMAYDNTGAVADSQAYRAHWWEASAVIRAEPESRLDLRYGVRPRAALDYFPSGATHAPLFRIHPRRLLAAQRKGAVLFYCTWTPLARHKRCRSRIHAGTRSTTD